MDLTTPIKEQIMGLMLNQKLTLRISINLVQSRTQDIRTGFDRVIDMVESDRATLRRNLMVCCVNFEAPRLHLAIVLLRDTFSYDDLKQTLCQGWQLTDSSRRDYVTHCNFGDCVCSIFIKGSMKS